MLQPTQRPPVLTAPSADEVDPLGLWSDASLSAVEDLMGRLAVGTRLERSGHMVQEHLATGGKRLRARLALAAAEALGGTRAPAVAWAAACELVHNATLIHDDLQDGDRVRRGHPTTWVRHGAAQAVNAGDLLLMLPFLALETVPVGPDTRWALARAVARRAEATVRGQSLELDLLGGRRTDAETWLRATEGKTGALLALPVEGAALLGGLSSDTAARIAAEFVNIGVLFQIADDLLDLYGDKGRGERGSDLREGKVSALVVQHLRLHPDDGPWLLALLEAPRELTPDIDVAFAIDRFRTRGALAATLQWFETLAAGVAAAPLLRAIPDLHSVAAELVEQIRGTLPPVRA
ncbi:MAG: polyprenyl synthetase family protein [Myxococcota bacterium]